MHTRPLNPVLYKALENRFGRVRVSNEGLSMDYRHSKDMNGKPALEIVRSGEYYRVNCPLCRDQRGRLYVNHRFGTVDDEGTHFGHFLVHCFNEECDMADFEDEIKMYLYDKNVKIIAPTGEMDAEIGLAPSPGKCVRLRDMKPESEVITYLKGRNFDLEHLEDDFFVGYCYEAAEGYRAMTGRIIIPIYYNGTLVGWQGRVTNNYAQPKYYLMPGFQKARILYNYDKAKHSKLVVVCEGVADVWRVGVAGVCVFGHTISHVQSRRIHNTWRNGAVAVVFDSKDSHAQEKATEWVEKARSSQAFKGGVANIVLPADDPADMSEKDLWSVIYQQCKDQSVTVPY